MKCPKCVNQELVARRVKGSNVVLYCCGQCKGLWFHRGQMELVVPEAVKDLRVPPDAQLGRRLCPACVKPMCAFHYPRTLVTIDMCKACLGLWIDTGECHEITVVRKANEADTAKDEPVAGTKGHVIDLVNAALDWVLYLY